MAWHGVLAFRFGKEFEFCLVWASLEFSEQEIVHHEEFFWGRTISRLPASLAYMGGRDLEGGATGEEAAAEPRLESRQKVDLDMFAWEVASSVSKATSGATGSGGWDQGDTLPHAHNT